MSLTPEEIAELQRKAAEAEELKQQIAALSGKKGEILDEKKQLAQQLKELQDAEAARKTKELEDQKRYQELLEETRKNNEELQKQLQEKDQAIATVNEQLVKDRLRTSFIAGVAAEVFNPEHVWSLFGGKASERDGRAIVVYKGAEIAPAELPAKLRADAEFSYLCRPVKKGGMGASATPPGGGGEPVNNPYITGNVTAQIDLQVANPEEAARLKAEARAARAAGAK
jgi:signal transduction histidine kinase